MATFFSALGVLARIALFGLVAAYFVMTGEIWYPGKPRPARPPAASERPAGGPRARPSLFTEGERERLERESRDRFADAVRNYQPPRAR